MLGFLISVAITCILPRSMGFSVEAVFLKTFWRTHSHKSNFLLPDLILFLSCCCICSPKEHRILSSLCPELFPFFNIFLFPSSWQHFFFFPFCGTYHVYHSELSMAGYLAVSSSARSFMAALPTSGIVSDFLEVAETYHNFWTNAISKSYLSNESPITYFWFSIFPNLCLSFSVEE